MAVKIHDPLKGKAYLKASLLTSKWLGKETGRGMGAPGVEKLMPVVLPKTMLQERLCCGRASRSVLTQSSRLQKKNAPKCYLLTEESSVELMAHL